MFPRRPRGATFGAILRHHNGAGPGFDWLRLGLALIILAAHCSWLSGTSGFLSSQLKALLHVIWPFAGEIPLDRLNSGVASAEALIPGYPSVTGLGRPFTLSHLPMFFALSGFLVAGSAFRTKRVVPFLGLRFLRIFPALCVEVTLSAIVLGAIFTNLPLSEYFRSSEFWTYFSNILGIVQLNLPGVFIDTSITRMVNGNLWTLPGEFHAYLIAAVLIAVGVLFNRVVYTGLFFVISCGMLVANTFFTYKVVPGVLDNDVNVYYFFVGTLFYLWRDEIPYRWSVFFAAGIVCYGLMFSTRTVFIYPVLLVYVTVFIGMTELPRTALLRSGDYSYGIYLYGFPITQALYASVPMLRNNLPGLLLATVAATSLFSCLSWHLIEKRVLTYKTLFSGRSAAINHALHPDASPGDGRSDLPPGHVVASSGRSPG